MKQFLLPALRAGAARMPAVERSALISTFRGNVTNSEDVVSQPAAFTAEKTICHSLTTSNTHQARREEACQQKNSNFPYYSLSIVVSSSEIIVCTWNASGLPLHLPELRLFCENKRRRAAALRDPPLFWDFFPRCSVRIVSDARCSLQIRARRVDFQTNLQTRTRNSGQKQPSKWNNTSTRKRKIMNFWKLLDMAQTSKNWCTRTG